MKFFAVYVGNLPFLLQILDLVPFLAHLYFEGKLPVTLSHIPASILLCIGLQGQSISYIEVVS